MRIPSAPAGASGRPPEIEHVDVGRVVEDVTGAVRIHVQPSHLSGSMSTGSPETLMLLRRPISALPSRHSITPTPTRTAAGADHAYVGIASSRGPCFNLSTHREGWHPSGSPPGSYPHGATESRPAGNQTSKGLALPRRLKTPPGGLFYWDTYPFYRRSKKPRDEGYPPGFSGFPIPRE